MGTLCAWLILYLYISNLKFLSSAYLYVEFQLNVSCFMIGLPSLGPTFCDLSASAIDMACIAALAALITPCAIATYKCVYSVVIIAYLLVCFMILIF